MQELLPQVPFQSHREHTKSQRAPGRVRLRAWLFMGTFNLGVKFTYNLQPTLGPWGAYKCRLALGRKVPVSSSLLSMSRMPHGLHLVFHACLMFQRADGRFGLLSSHGHHHSEDDAGSGDLLGVCGQVTPPWLEDFCELVTCAATILLAMLLIFLAAFGFALCLQHKVARQNYTLWSPTRLGRLCGMRCRLKFISGGNCDEGQPLAVLVAGRYEAAKLRGHGWKSFLLFQYFHECF
ncbi:unnamed protein product [Symbiodinium natans]|uniref:Uncharacterized protein n=1 Tax=Symbiodinium natans TaxID=878477 RepID=A0A812SB47_9DINO|nr:unnamed protein product [Symbiodinium natans]